MSAPQLAPDRTRFGDFELDLGAGELRQSGVRVPVPEQPLRLLEVLIEHPGLVVSREQLRERLWAADTFVDFEHGLNAAVKRLRDALGDSADQPRYIETVPKRGYRFIATLERTTSPSTGHAARGVPDTGDAALDLAAPSTTPDSTRELPTIRPRPRWWLRAAVVGLIVAASITAWLSWPASTAFRAAHDVMRLSIDLGPDVSLASPVLMSSNGERFVFLSNSRLVTRKLSQEVPVPLGGTEGAQEFFLSPDSQHVAFVVDGKLKRIGLDGGAVMTIADVPADTRGETWGEDDTIVFGSARAGLARVPASGGTPQPLTRLEPGEFTHRQPQFLPGGRALIFTSHRRPEDFDLARIEALTLSDGTRRTLQDNAYFGRFVGDAGGAGYLAFCRAGRMWAAAFDPTRLALLGSPVPVLEDVACDDIAGSAAVDASRTGTLAYRRQNKVRVDWLERDGSTRPLLEDPGYYEFARLSPDGKKLAYFAASDLVVYDIEGRQVTARLTRGIRVHHPIWTPNGRFVIFSRAQGLSWIRSDGPSEPRLLIDAANPPPQFPYSFRRGDNRLAYTESRAGNYWDVWTVKVLNGEAGLRAGEPEGFLVGPDDEGQPQFSPDGRWVAYRSAKTGRSEIYVRGFPKDGHVWPVSVRGGMRPMWSRSELFFQQGDEIMAVPYTVADSRIDFGVPRVWSSHRLAPLGSIGGYSVAPDGTRIAAIVPDPMSEPQSARSVTLIINAVEEFRRLTTR